MKIVIAGGNGFLGTALAERWSANHEVVILSRKLREVTNSGTPKGPGNLHEVYWNGRDAGPWATALEGADLLLNLAGKSVNCRYTTANKEQIIASRVESTRALAAAVKAAAVPPRVWMNASSATIYPHATGSPRDETFTDLADDFSVQVCKAWESAFLEQETADTRKIILRMAIVLGDGGALPRYARLAKLGLGGQHGSGAQMFSWIHIDDLGGIIEWLMRREAAQGIYNIAAPHAVTNNELMTEVRKAVGSSMGIHAPAWLLELAGWTLGTETELLLKSRWVLPGRLFQEGFRFQFGHIDEALGHLLKPRSKQVLHPVMN